MKTIDDHFTDWEGHVFGYGYGTGEAHILPALRRFLELCRHNSGSGYQYDELEREMTPPVAWLMINIMAHANVIEYGTSPRFAWLTDIGDRLKSFMATKTDEELYALTSKDQDYAHCYPDHCNCGDEDCHNPFWVEDEKRGNCR